MLCFQPITVHAATFRVWLYFLVCVSLLVPVSISSGLAGWSLGRFMHAI